MVLGNRFMADFCLDFETSRVKVDIEAVGQGHHVFVSGLARSGTTILMRRLYQSGGFVSLTYRDMPFVLMPLFWRRLSGGAKKQMEKTERAHGDGILVDYDSPEAFEEVFWRTCEEKRYLRKDRILPHRPSRETLTKFKRYIGVLLKSRGEENGHYLSKNNNNIVRLPALVDAFPNSLFLAPFRKPLQHAWSLLNQHRRFEVPDDKFTSGYMRWLGHHEFGADHRPFQFASDENPHDPDGLEYWLFLWNQVYRHLLDSLPPDVVFVSYETLCSDEGQTWQKIVEMSGIEKSRRIEDPLSLREREIKYQGATDLLEACEDTWKRLNDQHALAFS
ncbi:MAG: sulfotransferase [Candidatus Sumerlaeota bacterium]